MSKRQISPDISIRYKTIVATTSSINMHRLLVPFISSAVLTAFTKASIDEFSFRLINKVSPLSRVPCAILSLLCCRWSDLLSLSFPVLRDNTRISFDQPKTGRIKYISNEFIHNSLEKCDLPDNTPIVVSSYNQIRLDIRKNKRFVNFRIPPGCNDETHVFRHLRASWLYHLDTPVAEIQKILGHVDRDVVKLYLHPWGEINSTISF